MNEELAEFNMYKLEDACGIYESEVEADRGRYVEAADVDVR